MIHIEPNDSPDNDEPSFTFAILSDHYNRILHHVCRNTPGMRWNGDAWIGYADAVEVVQRRCLEYKLKVEGKVPSPEPPRTSRFSPKMAQLYGYQKEGLRFILDHSEEGALLALDVGLGKTLCTLRLIRAIMKADERGPAVIVCPAFVVGVWQDEAKKWGWDGDVVFLRGTNVDAATDLRVHKPTLYIVTAAAVHAWVDVLIKADPSCLVIDEIHMYQGDSEKSRRSAAVLRLRESIPHAWGLTGTPDPNRTKSLFPIFHILSPGRFGQNIYDFGKRYCNGKREEVAPNKTVWIFDGISNVPELNRRLEHCMFRRTKAEVAAELPPLRRQIISVDVGKSKRRMTGLIVNGKVNRSALRNELVGAAVAKIPTVVEMAASDVGAGHTVVIGTYRRAVADKIGMELASLGAVVVHGEMTPDKRMKLIKTKPKILVATIDSVGVGIDLSYADLAIVAELTYEPFELVQFEGRFHRRGQTRPVLIRYPIALGSIDEHVRDVVLTKMKMSKQSIGDAGDKMLEDMGASTSVEKILEDLCDRLMKEG